jgi:hypothetical protein
MFAPRQQSAYPWRKTLSAWLIAPVEEDDGRGGRKRTTPGKDSGRGAPQGSPLSPLLGNLYMRRFVLGWKQRGLESRLQAKIVSYADDYVICCKGDVDEALAEMREMLRRLKLAVNETTGKAYKAIHHYTPRRLRRWLCKKHKVRNSVAFPYEYLRDTLGLVELTTRRA